VLGVFGGGRMKGILTLPIMVPAAQRPDCLQCGRPYGRVRHLKIGELPIIEPAVCDQCWKMFGGTTAIVAKLEELAGCCDSDVEKILEELTRQPLFVLDPAAEELLASVTEYDHLHLLDRILIVHGIRWKVLRHIVPAARSALALLVTDRRPPAETRPADAPALWMEAVEQRFRANRGRRFSIGAEFKYRCKLRRWWYIARVWAMYAEVSGRPLSWVTQEEVAGIVGCSKSTVQRCVRWLREEGLLWEVVPGCQLPMMATPEGATPSEQAERARRLEEAIAAEETARERARAELAAVREGLAGEAAAAKAAEIHAAASDQAAAEAEDQEQPLVSIAPVYELRVPWTSAEQAEARDAAHVGAVTRPDGEKLIDDHKTALVASRNRHLYCDEKAVVTVVHGNGAHHASLGHELLTASGAFSEAPCEACGPVIGLLRGDPLGSDLHKHENDDPPVGGLSEKMISSTDGAVDKGRASRGIDQGLGRRGRNGPELDAEGRNRRSAKQVPTRPVSEPVRLAQRLKHEYLDRRVTAGVSVSKLAREIARSGLLACGWTEDDFVDQIHGYPEHPCLPLEIRNPGGWIHARLAQANPHLPPSKQRVIDEIERNSPLLQQRAVADRDAARQAEIRRRNAAIDNCVLCDELGWIDGPPPTARCNHDLNTGGW
jgi:hypothetical protein